MYLKIIQTDDQYEIYRYENSPLPNKGRTSRKPQNGPRRPIKRTFANTRRARKDFIRLVRANLTGNGNPSFVTLTMRDVVSIGVGYSALKGFCSSCRNIFGENFKYIAVPEFQKRGAIHFHILCWGIPDEIIKYERDTRILQNIWSLGYVDVLLTDGSPKLAGYLGKYMSKSMLSDDIGFSKAYTSSRNVLRPVSYSSAQSFALPENFWSDEHVILTERTYEVPWLGACTYQLLVKKT